MTLKELTINRGVVVANFIGIELLISVIISKHYLKEINYDFISNVLGDEQTTFGFKRNVLKHILNSDEAKLLNMDDLMKLNSLRNLFAHSPFLVNEKALETSKVFFRNPKKPKGDKLDADTEYSKFTKLHESVESSLNQIALKRNVNFKKNVNEFSGADMAISFDS